VVVKLTKDLIIASGFKQISNSENSYGENFINNIKYSKNQIKKLRSQSFEAIIYSAKIYDFYMSCKIGIYFNRRELQV
jgi:hypothetical protein